MAATVAKVGSEILVNTAIADIQFQGQITALSNGGFVASWTDRSSGVGGTTGDSSGAAVKAQVFAANGTRIGSELLVNTATDSLQAEPQISALPNGGFVVTWIDDSNGVGGATGDSNPLAVKAQVFLDDGTRLGSELLVNTATFDSQDSPQITALPNGGFVVTWDDFSQGSGGAAGDSSGRAVKAQVFLSDGTRVGSELLVNTATADDQSVERIAALANGGFVVTWDDKSLGVGGATGDASAKAVKAQVFLSSGTRVGSELLGNAATANDQSGPKTAPLANGGFVMVWEDNSHGVGGAPGDGDGVAVKAQVFAADGTRVGAELLVNSATAGLQRNPQIAALPNGGFVVTWEDLSQGIGGTTGDNSGAAVKAQVFAADGTRVGSELLVNSATAGVQELPQIVTLANGAFVVAWADSSQGVGGTTGDGSSRALKAQVFLPDGTRVGSELLVNSATAGSQADPHLAALQNGGFVVTWRDDSHGVGGATGDDNSAAVKAQVFAVNLSPEISSDGGSDNAGISFSENGTAVTRVTAIDITTLAFSIVGGEDAARFLIDAQTGALRFFAAPNFEAPTDSDADNGYVVQVRVSDGALEDTQTITVNVTDVKEVPGADGDGNTLFDTLFYLSRNPDVVRAELNALDHFNTSGFHEGRDPNAFFDSSGYLAVNKDVADAGLNPLEHFHQAGWQQGRDPGPDFDTTLYLLRNPDVAAAHVDPLEHFFRFGFAEGRSAFPAIGAVADGFDAQHYLFHNPDVAAAGVDALLHYNTIGWREGRNPNAYFDTAGYLSHYADVAAAGVNPLEHYQTFGFREGRDPSAGFDTLGYLAVNPDVAAAHINPLDHFLQFGIYEGRAIVNDGLFH